MGAPCTGVSKGMRALRVPTKAVQDLMAGKLAKQKQQPRGEDDPTNNRETEGRKNKRKETKSLAPHMHDNVHPPLCLAPPWCLLFMLNYLLAFCRPYWQVARRTPTCWSSGVRWTWLPSSEPSPRREATSARCSRSVASSPTPSGKASPPGRVRGGPVGCGERGEGRSSILAALGVRGRMEWSLRLYGRQAVHCDFFGCLGDAADIHGGGSFFLLLMLGTKNVGEVFRAASSPSSALLRYIQLAVLL